MPIATLIHNDPHRFAELIQRFAPKLGGGHAKSYEFRFDDKHKLYLHKNTLWSGIKEKLKALFDPDSAFKRAEKRTKGRIALFYALANQEFEGRMDGLELTNEEWIDATARMHSTGLRATDDSEDLRETATLADLVSLAGGHPGFQKLSRQLGSSKAAAHLFGMLKLETGIASADKKNRIRTSNAYNRNVAFSLKIREKDVANFQRLGRAFEQFCKDRDSGGNLLFLRLMNGLRASSPYPVGPNGRIADEAGGDIVVTESGDESGGDPIYGNKGTQWIAAMEHAARTFKITDMPDARKDPVAAYNHLAEIAEEIEQNDMTALGQAFRDHVYGSKAFEKNGLDGYLSLNETSGFTATEQALAKPSFDISALYDSVSESYTEGVARRLFKEGGLLDESGLKQAQPHQIAALQGMEEALRAHCKERSIMENVNFLRTIARMRRVWEKLPDEQSKRKLLGQCINEYVRNYSPQYINISFALRGTIVNGFDNYPQTPTFTADQLWEHLSGANSAYATIEGMLSNNLNLIYPIPSAPAQPDKTPSQVDLVMDGLSGSGLI